MLDRARILRENAEKFRRMARTDRPQKDMWLRRATAADSKAAEIEEKA